MRLNLGNERAVREAAAEVLGRARAAKPEARITGVTVFPMIVRPKARELIAGIADDPDIRSRHRFRPRRHGGRSDQRQGAGAAAARPRARPRPHCAHAGLPHPQGLPQCAGGGRTRRRTRCWSSLRSLRPIFRRFARSISIRFSPTRPASSPSTPASSIAPVEKLRRGPSGHPRFAIRPYPKEWERRMTTAGRNGHSGSSRPAGRRAVV